MSGLRHVLLFVIICPGLNSFAQSIVPRFETLDVENGLSQNSVYSIYQDKKGFMWFGTADGLNRYDGENVKVFKSHSPALNQANSNFIRGWLCEDKLGRIWFANETGIYFFNPVNEQVERAYDFLKDTQSGFIYYTGMLLDNNENLWLINPGKGIVKFSIHSRQYKIIKYPSEIKPDEYASFPQPGTRHIYLHFANKPGVLRFNIYTEEYEWMFQGYPNLRVKTDKQKLIASQDEKLFYYDSVKNELQSIPIHAKSLISQLAIDSLGRYWLSTMGDGLYSYSPEQQKTKEYRHDISRIKSLPSDIATCLFIDANQNLWIGMDGGGVSRLDLKPPQFNIFPLVQGEYPDLKNYFIRCFYEDELGRIWFGTHLNGLVIFDPKEGSIKIYSREDGSLPGNSVGSIFRDREGKIWIGHDYGISLFDGTRLRQVPLKAVAGVTPINNQVTQIIELNSGELLMTTFYGIYIIKKDGKGFYEGFIWKSFTSRTMGVHQNDDEHVWVASQVEGLYHVRPEDSLVTNAQKFFNRINIRSIHQDEQESEILWLCSGAGLIRFDTHSTAYKLYKEEDGIPGGFVYGLIEDDNHNFWLSTNSGLCFFNRKDETFQTFTVKDGLQSNEFNRGAFYKGPSGTIYFGGIKGFNWFRSGAERATSKPPKSAIISTLVNDVAITNDSSFYLTRSLSLPHDKNDLLFEFAVFDYTRPEANKIQYMLEGWDKQWITTHQKSTRYSNLPHGNYIFRVRASSSTSDWGEEDYVSISIQAPFWKTNWFYATISLILIGVIAGITRMIAHGKFEKKLLEIEKQRAVLEERDRISKDIHDDLGTGLTKISILSQLARQSKSVDEFTQRQLDKISMSSHELIDNLSELIWSHNPTNDSLRKLLWYIREHLNPMFDGTQTKLNISIPDLPEDISVPAEWRRNIFLVTKESLHNVLKHSEATQASLTYSVVENRLIIVISDNGRGFDFNTNSNSGNGLTNIHKRINECRGTVHIESHPGQGTKLSIEVPLIF